MNKKHPAIARIRGLLLVIEQRANDPALVLLTIKEIVEQLKILNNEVLLVQKQNIAGPQSPVLDREAG